MDAKTPRPLYKGHRFPPEIISYCVWLYYRFSLSYRDIELLSYTEWRKFADALERAMMACQNSGQAPSDHFVLAAKTIPRPKGASKDIQDYHLTRYACYLVAINSDPRKAQLSQAQTYFAVKTREAELLAVRTPVSLHALTDAMRPSALENLQRVPESYFSVQAELFGYLYNLEAILN